MYQDVPAALHDGHRHRQLTSKTSAPVAMFLQKAWGIRNAYKHGTSVDVFESASERRGADGIDARA
jgi:hypothetical protein